MTEKAADNNVVFVCRCEEVTEFEVRDLVRQGITTVDGIKRASRAGMGLCQSKTCYTNIARIIKEETGISMAELVPLKIRIPVRPLKVSNRMDAE